MRDGDLRRIRDALETLGAEMVVPRFVTLPLPPIPRRGSTSIHVPTLPKLGPVHEARVRLSAWWCLWWRWTPWLPVVQPTFRVVAWAPKYTLAPTPSEGRS